MATSAKKEALGHELDDQLIFHRAQHLADADLLDAGEGPAPCSG